MFDVSKTLRFWLSYSRVNWNGMAEGVTEEHGMADLFQQLIDVSGVHNWGIVEHKVLQDLGLNWSDLCSVVCHFLYLGHIFSPILQIHCL